MKNKVRSKVMLITALIGIVASILFSINISVETHFEVLLGTFVYYPIAWFVIIIGFKWKFEKNSVWIATLASLPVWPALIVPLITGSFEFLKLYALIGITCSVLIFEYKLLE